jgi:hypothetical protein
VHPPVGIRGLIVTCFALLFVQTAVADETRWRLVKIGSDGDLMLVMTETDDATDAIGFPYFLCKSASGLVTVENNMQDNGVRRAIAGLILNDGYPTIELVPGPQRSVINEVTSKDDGGWGYRFQIDADGAAFNAFGRSGYFEFKIGNAKVKAGVKAGLDEITKFQSACRRLPKPSVFDGPKVKK